MALSFNKRIELITTKSGFIPGAVEEVIFSKAWADIKTMQGKEIQSMDFTAHEMSTRFIIRYMEGITPDMKIKYKGNLYEIKGMVNDNEENRTLTLIGTSIS